MKKIKLVIFILCGCLMMQTIFAQAPSKAQLQSKMNQFTSKLNKQIVDLEEQIAEKKKNKADAETIRQLENQLAALKSQVKMMGDVGKGVSKVSEKALQQSRESANIVVPKKDLARINMIPKKLLNTAELLIYLKNVHASVEKSIPVQEKQDALQEYNEVNAKFKSTVITANAANGFWLMGHWEKALFIMGKVCLDDVTDADNLNNYAAFLINSGGEHAAIPILDYLNNLYPENSTILNNLGQAWFGLGDLDKAKKNLNEATGLYFNHSGANETLSKISQFEGDNEKTISFLKASLKAAYDPDKEQQLERLGYTIKFDDLPPLNFPMKKDPLGLFSLINSVPEQIQTDVNDRAPYYALKRYLNGVANARKELTEENIELSKKLSERYVKLGQGGDFSKEYMEPYNYSPAYWLSLRARQLICFEYDGSCSKKPKTIKPFITSLMLPAPAPDLSEDLDALPLAKLVAYCKVIWYEDVLVPSAGLLDALSRRMKDKGCEDYTEVMNEYLRKRGELYQKGFSKIKNEFVQKSAKLDYWIKYTFYGSLDDRMPTIEDEMMTFIGDLSKNLEAKRNANIEIDNVFAVLDQTNDLLTFFQKECGGNEIPDPNPGSENLSRYKVNRVECQVIKKIVFSNEYQFELVCNAVKEKTGSKNKKRKTEIQKGSVQSSKPGIRDVFGPLQQIFRRGPNGLSDLPGIARRNLPSPLTAEDKDLSQFSITYDKWGNLISLDLQLNEDGTGLLDETSVVSGMDSRWSWNAIASSKKGPLNKLVIK